MLVRHWNLINFLDILNAYFLKLLNYFFELLTNIVTNLIKKNIF